MQRQQNSTNHPLLFLMVSSTDHVTPVFGATCTAYLSKDGNGKLTAAVGAVTENSLTTPTGLTVTPTGTTGATNYGYRIAALNGLGVTLACTEVTTATGNATLSGTNYNALSWSAVPGASTYNVYGRTSGGELLMTNVSGTTYNDTGAATPSGALPTQNTTSGGFYSLAGNATDRNTLGTCGIIVAAAGCDNAPGKIEIKSEDPFSVFNVLTNAGLQGGVAINDDSLICTVSASPAPTTTVFASATLTSGTNYANSFVVFKTGVNQYAPARKIASVSGTTITLGTPLPNAPAFNDLFELIGYAGT